MSLLGPLLVRTSRENAGNYGLIVLLILLFDS